MSGPDVRPAMDPLEALLHRCHRAELLPLARILQVKTEGIGLADLARALSITLRRAGSHDIANAAFRRGHGRPYIDLLRRVAKGYGLQLAEYAEPGEIERAVLAAHFQKRWDATDIATRTALWEEFGIAAPLPETSSGALALAAQTLGRSFDYVLSTTVNVVADPGGLALLTLLNLSPLGCVVRPLMVPLLPVSPSAARTVSTVGLVPAAASWAAALATWE